MIVEVSEVSTLGEFEALLGWLMISSSRQMNI